MSEKREPIPELIGRTITDAEFIDGGVWFDVKITTDDGHVITAGGYKGDASASLTRQPTSLLTLSDVTVRGWDW